MRIIAKCKGDHSGAVIALYVRCIKDALQDIKGPHEPHVNKCDIWL